MQFELHQRPPRRRKRARRQPKLGGQHNKRKADFYERYKKRPVLDDDLSEFKFLTSCDYDSSDDEKKNSSSPSSVATGTTNASVEEEKKQQEDKSLPFLLYQREMGYYNTRRRGAGSNNRHDFERWQSNILLSSSTFQDNTNNSNQSSSSSGHKRRHRQWRGYASRSIPFTKLETPPSDAVLALERSGSYVLSLSGGGGPRDGYTTIGGHESSSSSSSSLPSLMLKFYGLPSRSKVWKQKNNQICYRTSITSPLLRTVPLTFDDGLNHEETHNRNNLDPSNYWLSNGYFSAPVSVPVRLLISSDWKIGIAFLPSNSNSATTSPPSSTSAVTSLETDYDNLGTLIIFPLPRQRAPYYMKSTTTEQTIPRLMHSFKYTNVQIGGLSAFTTRNLLWKVDTIPYYSIRGQGNDDDDNNERQTRLLCDSCLHIPGYLLFNDEDDGFRLVWVVDTAWDKRDNVCIQPTTNEFSFSRIPDQDIVRKISPQDEKGNNEMWEDCWNDSQSGRRVEKQYPRISTTDRQNEQKELSIAFNAYMDVQAILSDIIFKRKTIRSKLGYDCTNTTTTADANNLHRNRSFPDYFYNLISVTAGGRHVEVIIAFRAIHKAGCFGVFVHVDLFTQTYEEMEWVQNSCICDAASLRKWSNKLAVNRRMRQRMLGPYCCVGQDKSCNMDWSLLCKETESGFDLDEHDNFSPSLWRKYLNAIKKQARHHQSGLFSYNNVSGGMDQAPKVPKTISFSSLYPDCDLVTNSAVTTGKPVLSLACKISPIRLVYG